MKQIKFPYRDSVVFPALYTDKLLFNFPYSEDLSIQTVYPDSIAMSAKYLDKIAFAVYIKPLPMKISLNDLHGVRMGLTHEKLAFGMDPFMLYQLDGLAIGTIDTFPLDIK